MFFFYKQKTAYELRISDWSSDVCSSDLEVAFDGVGEHLHHLGADVLLGEDGREAQRRLVLRKSGQADGGGRSGQAGSDQKAAAGCLQCHALPPCSCFTDESFRPADWPLSCCCLEVSGHCAQVRCARSEEHTSELQSLLLISYAVI